MPNWVNNRVCINIELKAPISDYLVTKKDRTMMFNMHRIYPDIFTKNDKTGEKNWDYDQAIELTGSKWYPEIDDLLGGDDDDYVELEYDTAWSPNNRLLERLHQLTGRHITNTYVEEGNGFLGRFTCQNGYCKDRVIE